MLWNIILNKRKSITQVIKQISTKNDVRPKYFKNPFMKCLSEKFQDVLYTMDTKIAFNHTKITVSLYSSMTDRLLFCYWSNVGYKINCIDCESVYVGTINQKKGEQSFSNYLAMKSTKIKRPELSTILKQDTIFS